MLIGLASCYAFRPSVPVLLNSFSWKLYSNVDGVSC